MLDILRKRFENWIIKTYQKIRKKETFILESKIIKVKKGKIKYYLFISETEHGKIKLNLGRHNQNFLHELS